MVYGFRATWVAALLIGTGCSRSPQQYGGGEPPKAGPQLTLASENLPSAPTNELGGLVDGRVLQEDPNAIDNKIRFNSSKPIILGVGAGGITMNTTYEESRDILAPEWFTSDGLTFYREFLAVGWREQDPRKADLMVIYNGYTGPLQMPDGYKEVRIGSELGEYFTAEDPQGRKMINDMWRMMNPTADEGDCLEGNLAKQPSCILQVNNEAGQIIVFFQGYGGMILSNDERKALGLVLLQQNLPGFSIGQAFDLVKGEFNGAKKEEDKIVRYKFGIGQSWGELNEIVSAKTDTSVTATNFFKPYNGIYIWLSKSKFDFQYIQPDSSEIVTDVAITSGVTISLLINGRIPYVSKTGTVKSSAGISSGSGSSSVALTPQIVIGSSAVENPFATDRSVKLNFATSLGKLLEKGFRSTYAKSGSEADVIILPSLVTGQYSTALYPEFITTAGYFDTNKGDGLLVQASTSLGLPSVSFYASKIQHMADIRALMGVLKPTVAGSGSLGGFNVGDLLTLKDVDRVRKEATVVIDGEEIRSAFEERQVIKVAYFEADKVQEKNMIHDVVWAGGVRIAHAMLDHATVEAMGLPTDQGQSYAQILALTASGHGGSIENLCDASEFMTPSLSGDGLGEGGATVDTTEAEAGSPIKFGMLDNEFFSIIDNSNPKTCKFFTPFNSLGLDVKDTVYFPQVRTKVIFKDRELSALTLY